MQPGKRKLKNLVIDKPNSRLFLTSGDGQIYIYSMETHPPKQLVCVSTFSRSVIRGLFINFKKGYLFTTCMDGTISCFELGKPGREKFMKEIATMKGKVKVRPTPLTLSVPLRLLELRPQRDHGGQPERQGHHLVAQDRRAALRARLAHQSHHSDGLARGPPDPAHRLQGQKAQSRRTQITIRSGAFQRTGATPEPSSARRGTRQPPHGRRRRAVELGSSISIQTMRTT